MLLSVIVIPSVVTPPTVSVFVEVAPALVTVSSVCVATEVFTLFALTLVVTSPSPFTSE